MASWQTFTVTTLLAFSSICLAPVELRGQTQSTWTNPAGGIWSDASNWDTDAPVNGSPNASSEYVADIDLETGTPYDVLQSGFTRVNGIRLDSADARLRIGGALDLNSSGNVEVADGDFIFSGGTIQNGSLNQSGGRILVDSSDGTVRSATLLGDVIFESSGSILDVIDSTVTGSVDLSNGGLFRVDNTNQVFENTDIQFGGDVFLGGFAVDRSANRPGFSGGSSLTFEETANVSGRITVSVGQSATNAMFLNRTLLSADGNDETAVLTLQARGSSTEVVNEGRIVGVNGARLELNDDFFVLDTGLFVNAAGGEILLSSGSSATLGSASGRWRNEGLIELDDSRLTLSGNYSASDLGTISRRNRSELVFGGRFDNDSQVFEVNETTGDIILRGAIAGGTVQFDGAELLFEGSSLLDGARVDGTIKLSNSQTNLAIANGGGFTRLEITGTDSGVTYSGLGNRLASGESISLGSTGVIDLNVLSRDGDLTFEEGSSVSGGGRISSSLSNNGGITNQGTIDVSGRLVIDVDDRVARGNQFTNEGVINVEESSTLAVNDSPFVGHFSGRFVNAESGVINVGERSRLNLEDFWQNLGTINVASGGRVNIDFGTATQSTQAILDKLSGGTINRTEGSTVSIDANLDNSNSSLNLGEIGDLQLSGGSISGGTIEQTTDARLNLSRLNRVRDLTINGGLSFDRSASFDIDNSTVNGDIIVGSDGNVLGIGVLQSNDGGILNLGTLQAAFGTSLELRVPSGEEIRNAGVLFVSENSNLIIEGVDLIQTSGMTELAGGELSLAERQVFDLQGGALEGFGTINGDVFLNGELAIGEVLPAGFSFDTFEFLPERNVAGEILVNGDLDLGDSASILFDILGRTRGQTTEGFDFLLVDGELALNGALQVGLDPFFADSLLNGEEFIIATGDSISGEFDNVSSGSTLSTLDGLFTFEVDYGAGSNSVTLRNFAIAVPEPGSSTLILLVAVIASLKRNRGNFIESE